MSHRRPTVACLLFHLLISPLCGVAQTPNRGMLVIPFIYKPFLWCRSDARLRHDAYYYPFEASLQTPDRCIFYLYSRIAYSCFYMNNLHACIMDFVYFVTDIVIIEYFRTWLSFVVLYPCSQCLRVHSNVLTGLSLAIVLARFLAWRGASRWQPREPKQRW